MDNVVLSAIARVDVYDGDQLVSRGAGVLVAGDLFLTALHVVADRQTHPPRPRGNKILLLFRGGTVTAKRLERFNAIEDWALLECTPPPPTLPLQFATCRDGEKWESLGYPKAKPDGLVLKGTVTSVNVGLDGGNIAAYQLFCDEASGEGLLLPGTSGAPVIIDGAVVGILRWATFREAVDSSGNPVRISAAGTIFACPAYLVAEGYPERFPAVDPYRGLPGVPRAALPVEPYRYLTRYTEADAQIFFGRGDDIRTLYFLLTDPHGSRVVILFGQSGVGKSSLIDAGLRPRLQFAHHVIYLRREIALSLHDLVRLHLLPAAAENVAAHADVWAGLPLHTVWAAAEAQRGCPLVIVLDQVEEIYVRPRADRRDELLELLLAMGQAPPALRGRLVLSFRKEWLGEVEEALKLSSMQAHDLFLKRLTRDGIVEAVQGLTATERLRKTYRLTVEAGLPELIADTLLADPHSPIAPTLQILLTDMWKRSRLTGMRAFTKDGFRELQASGIGLATFVDQQLKAIEEREPDLIQSGLALDLLAYHTTALATTQSRTATAIQQTYQDHGNRIGRLLQLCKDNYLLVDSSTVEDGSTRLAHDTLAPLIRQRFDQSLYPGQRARRILELRAAEWRDGPDGPTLDEHDLAIVESGRTGMRSLTSAEQRLVAASTMAAERRRAHDEARADAAAVRTLFDRNPAEALLKSVHAVYLSLKADQQIPPEVEASLVVATSTIRERKFAPMFGAAVGPGGIVAVDWERSDVVLKPLDLDARPIGAEIRLESQGAPAFFRVRMSADGSRVAAAIRELDDSGSLSVFDKQGRRLATRAAAGVSTFDFAADGSLIVGYGDGSIQTFDADGVPIIVPSQVAPSPIEHVLAIDTNHGRRVVTRDREGVLKLCSWTGTPISELGRDVTHIATATSAVEGPILAVCRRDRTVHVCNPDGRALSAPAVHESSICGVALSADGALVATVEEQGNLRIAQWNVSDDTVTFHGAHTATPSGGGNQLAFSADGATLVVASGSGIVSWFDTHRHCYDTCQEVAAVDWRTPVAYSARGRAHFVGDNRLIVWADNDTTVTDPFQSRISALACAATGELLAVGHENGDLRVCDIAAVAGSSESASLMAEGGGRVIGLVFRPDNTFLVVSREWAGAESGSSSPLGSVEVWDVQQRKRLFVAETWSSPHPALLFESNHTIGVVSGSAPPARIAVFDYTGKRVSDHELWLDGEGAGASVAHPDGETVLVVASNGALYHLHTDGKPVDMAADPVPIASGVFTNRFSVAEHHLFTPGKNGIDVWTVEGTHLLTLGCGRKQLITLCASSPGHLAAVFSDGASLRWRLDWQTHLALACRRLRGHPVWGQSDREIVFRAHQVCDTYATARAPSAHRSFWNA